MVYSVCIEIQNSTKIRAVRTEANYTFWMFRSKLFHALMKKKPSFEYLQLMRTYIIKV